MKVRFEQAGGVTGLVKGCEVDAGALSEPARAAMAHLRPPAAPAAAAAVRDAIQYTVTVEDGGKTRTVELPAGGVPPALQPLIQELKKQAKPMPLD